MLVALFLDRGACFFENSIEADASAVAGAERRNRRRRATASYSIHNSAILLGSRDQWTDLNL
jgi:hypothetical protein